MPGTSDRSERWAGGFVRVVGEGGTRERVYVIRKMVSGVRYEVSTRRGTEAEALLELVKFKNSPATYDPTPPPDLIGDDGPMPVYLDANLVKEYLDHCKVVGISKVWWNSKRLFLNWWQEKLHGIDLRGADLKQAILGPLEGASSRQHRVAVIKHLYAWLRDADTGKGLLTASEDPTLSVLKVPQRAPAQQTKRRAFSVKDLARVKKALANGPQWRLDAIEVLAGTGWHYSELRRFAEAGSIEQLPGSQQVKKPKKAGKERAGAEQTAKEKAAAEKAKAASARKQKKSGVAVLVTVHKGGQTHRTAVSPKVRDAAERIRKSGHLSAFHLNRVLQQVSAKLKLEVPVTAGSFRHTVATEAIERGASPAQVSAFLGHRSPETTKRFYATLAVVPKVPTLA